MSIENKFPLLNLTDDLLGHVLSFIVTGKNDRFSSRLIDHRCNNRTDEVFRQHWGKLKIEQSRGTLPKGLVDLSTLMGKIDQRPLTTNPSRLFMELANEFSSYGATLSMGRLPLTTFEFENLQKQAQNANDALIAIWPKISTKILSPPHLNRAEEIRSWLNDINNADHLNRITLLDLSNLDLRVLPQEITKLIGLKYLYLNNNKLNSLPHEIVKLTQLHNLSLGRNQFSILPPEIGALAQLQDLLLSNNRLSSLPNTIGALTQLQCLSLSNNQLRFLPPEIAKLTKLQYLSLSNNQLSSLPPEIGALTCLKKLFLFSNQLSSLPNTIGALKQLQQLFLDNNQLSSLPLEIGALSQLQTFKLTKNPLKFIPDEVLNSSNSVIRDDVNLLNYKNALMHRSFSS